MSLSDELLHFYGRTDRPNPVRNRAIPIVPISYGREWLALLRLFGGGALFFFTIGAVAALLWSL